MSLLGKVVFIIPLAINGLITLFYWEATLFSLIKPPSPYYTTGDGIIFITGCTVILALIARAYNLAFVQNKITAGFLTLGLSFLTWPVFIIVGVLLADIKIWR